MVIERKVYDVTGASRLDGSSDFDNVGGSGMISMTGFRSLEDAQDTYNWASRLGEYPFRGKNVFCFILMD